MSCMASVTDHLKDQHLQLILQLNATGVRPARTCRVRRQHAYSSKMGRHDVVLLLLAPAPALILSLHCQTRSDHSSKKGSGSMAASFGFPDCHNWHQHPVASVNQMLFWNMCVLFWVISLFQKSTWVSCLLPHTLSSHLHQPDTEALLLLHS